MTRDERRAWKAQMKSRWHAEIERCYPRYRLARSLSMGGVMIGGGLAWLMAGGANPWMSPASWALWLPMLVGWTGLVRVVVMRNAFGVVSGLQRLATAAMLYVVLNGMWGLSIWQVWPAFLVIWGVGIIARGLFAPVPFDGDCLGGFGWGDRGRDAPPGAPSAAPAPAPATELATANPETPR